MDLLQQHNLASDQNFISRCESAGVHTAIAVANEVVNEAQTLHLTGGTAGTFTLSFGGQTTVAIAFNAGASAVQTALQALSSIGNGNVVCTGGPIPGADIVITFTGTLGSMPQNLITIGTNSVTGGTPSVSRTTTGVSFVNHTARAALASKVLANPSGYGVLFAKGVADNATVQADFDPATLVPTAAESQVKNDIQFQVNSIFSNYA